MLKNVYNNVADFYSRNAEVIASKVGALHSMLRVIVDILSLLYSRTEKKCTNSVIIF